MGSWKGRGNQYIQLVKVLYCKLLTDGKLLPAFPLEAVPGTKPWPQRWESRVLPLCHRGPNNTYSISFIFMFIDQISSLYCTIYLFIWGFVAFNTVQVISQRVVGRAEETSTYSSLGFCTVNC